ncbi:hypothetical protein [Rhizobacter sp. Root1221]|uniref:hypothetical protein n=1 Tax=Rhizobacter sp. Root1221 TaxID=1736433 RepID=UPI00138F4A89|nr:hypothetical protein [Rhizobacter sp. Root1221]
MQNSFAESAQLEISCEKQWIEKSATHVAGPAPDVPTMLKVWKSLESECGSTHTYIGRLALLSLMTDDFAAARRVLKAAPKGDSRYAYSIDAARIQLSIRERLAADGPISDREAAEFELKYIQLVKKYPDWPTGFALLGGWQTSIGKHDAAINNLQKALKGDAYNLAGVYRNLTISFAAEGSSELALAASDKTFKLNPSITSDSQFVYAYANASSALGYLDDAELALNLIARKKAEVKGDPEYKKAVEFYSQQRKKSPKK